MERRGNFGFFENVKNVQEICRTYVGLGPKKAIFCILWSHANQHKSPYENTSIIILTGWSPRLSRCTHFTPTGAPSEWASCAQSHVCWSMHGSLSDSSTKRGQAPERRRSRSWECQDEMQIANLARKATQALEVDEFDIQPWLQSYILKQGIWLNSELYLS